MVDKTSVQSQHRLTPRRNDVHLAPLLGDGLRDMHSQPGLAPLIAAKTRAGEPITEYVCLSMFLLVAGAELLFHLFLC